MEGLIYKVQPYLEHARLLYVYTPVGKKTLLAQGAQKTNQSSRVLAQYLTLISFKDQDHKQFLTLMDAKIINDYGDLKRDFNQTKMIAVMLEVIDRFIDEMQPHAHIFSEMLDVLKSKAVECAVLSFLIKILKFLGYPINFQANGKPVLGLNIERGGLIYTNQQDVVDLDVKLTIELLKLSLVPYASLETLTQETQEALKSFIQKYYQYHLQQTLKNL